MTLKTSIRLEGHDWDRDLHFSYLFPIDFSVFEKHPHHLFMDILRYRLEMEAAYKKAFIKKGHHLKLVDN